MAIGDADRLLLYNGATRLIGEKRLQSVSEERESRHYLDDVWDNGAIDFCLEQGMWKFAMRTVELTYSPSIDPAFGYQYAFDKPTDLLRLSALSADEYLRIPLLDYRDDAGFWFADIEPIYASFTSNDDEFGYDPSLWTQRFRRYVEAYLASEIALSITQIEAEKRGQLRKLAKERLIDAQSHDAQAGPTRFPPEGNWVLSRYGRGSKRDRGSRRNLIG